MSSADGATPQIQKVWMVVKQGDPRDALELKTDISVPLPKPGEVLVRVRAAALNPVGWKMMKTLPNILSRRPHPAEHDLAGVIVDANGTAFSNGDEVIGFVSVPLQFYSRKGALAQYVALPVNCVTLKPTKLSWEEAAALPLAALTALQGLRLGGYDPADALSNPTATPHDSIFVYGGSTSVGIYAIQLAKALSLHVTACASARNESFVRELGADVFLDYTARPIAEQLAANPPDQPFGMVLDAVGLSDTALYVNSGSYVKKGGVYVTVGPWPEKGKLLRMVGGWGGAMLRPSILGGVPTKWKILFVNHNKNDMQTLCALIERGVLRPYVDSTHGFESALDAYDKILTSRARGKVVVQIE